MNPTTTALSTGVPSVAPRTLQRALALIYRRAAREPRVNPLTKYAEMPGEWSVRNLALARALGCKSERTGRRVISRLVEMGCISARAVKLGAYRGGFMVLELKAIPGQIEWTFPTANVRSKSSDVAVDLQLKKKGLVVVATAPTTRLAAPKTPKATPLTDEQREVVDWYFHRFVEKRGCEPPLPMKWALDLGEQVTRHGVKKSRECVDRFFQSRHPFIINGNYHVRALLWVWGELLAGGMVDRAEMKRRRKILRLPDWKTDSEINEAYAQHFGKARSAARP